ncbi:FKBP12-associated protein [Fusarium equiseti]|uniref:FKBP12-associated protein n=1 Tax=Fusarium equiseti TaxID=61235 RepID=A0ABQ8RT33_FUSEQ|nr:FKBP12-associated protein [Fusarium equiseti]
MAEQETSRASNQAQSQTQNRPQNEGQGPASGSRGGSRGGRRRGRGGRNRGQRQDGSAQEPGGYGNAPQTHSADAAVATAHTTAPTEPAASNTPESLGSSRNRRNRRGNRGGARGSVEQGRGVFTMGPRRQFGGRLTTNEQPSDAAAEDASLRANAPEFVPGQSVPQRRNGQQAGEPQAAAQTRSRGNRTRNRRQDRPRQEVPKSTASELWQRIQEDIANWNYECRICTEEVTRKTEVWSCGTCWTVVHLECAHQWWDTSMKINEESGDKSWRCPGCNSTLTDEPGDRSAKRNWTAAISVDPSAILVIATLAHKPWKSIAVVAVSRPRRCVMEQKSNTPCASRYARQTGTVEDIVAVSIAAQEKRKLFSGLLSKRSNVLAPTHSPSKPSTYVSRLVADHSSAAVTVVNSYVTVEPARAVQRPSGRKFPAAAALLFFIHHNLVVLVNLLAQTSVDDSPVADILPSTTSATPMMWIVHHAYISLKKPVCARKPHSITSHVTFSKSTAVRCAGRSCLAASIHARNYAIVLESVEMHRMAANSFAGSRSLSAATRARVFVMVRLLVTSRRPVSNPTPNRPELRCDEECERLDRNRRLAAALNIDPASHTNDHIPFSDDTLKLYKQFPKWGDEQESQFRVFAANKDEVRLRYEPMKNTSRQFLHLLAIDFGFESKSEDHDIHRSVVVWKADKFVSAPPKTLSQSVKIRAAQAAEAAAAAAIRPPSPPVLETEPFNALVLLEPRFGLTNDEVNAALAPDLSSLQGFSFKVDFLNDEVLIKATVAYSAFLTPAPLEKGLEVLKPRIEQTIRREKLAENVLLCHSDVNGAITRREMPRRAGAGGWSAVAGRAASKPGSSSAAEEEAKPGRRLLLGLKKKKPQPEAGKVWAALDGDVEC